ncbi:bacteriohemerythrin [Desulfobulbus sp.]|uniref:bacteriohemerythrin n=1 Tax=Desulfobulbus sp. TaxID=895 RepID=UPI00286F190C|nr:bacteriohemerythrin [Desulfobulbus sp.]
MNIPLYIIWSEENNLGIPIVDEQHRAIISTINTLHYFMRNKNGTMITSSTVTILNEYTKFHFITEEGIIKNWKYPEAESHIKLHNELYIKTIDMTSKLRIHNDNSELLQFLKNWWIRHICIEDKKYASFILRRSLTDVDADRNE